MYPAFGEDILAMNARYKLEDINVENWNSVRERLTQFKDILDKEFNELEDIETLADTADDENNLEVTRAIRIQMADLLADIMVYCASEAARWKLPLGTILRVIMLSNTSKLGADGQPIINPANGKFEKGPNYWKPEPAIDHILHCPGGGIIEHDIGNGVCTVELLSADGVRVRDEAVQRAMRGVYDDPFFTPPPANEDILSH